MSNLDQGFYFQHLRANPITAEYYAIAAKFRDLFGIKITCYVIEWRKFAHCYWVHIPGLRPRFVSFNSIK